MCRFNILHGSALCDIVYASHIFSRYICRVDGKLPITDTRPPLDQFDMGRVMVSRHNDNDDDGALFWALVIPMRDIPVGSTVEIAIMSDHNPLNSSQFLIVR